VDRPDLAERVEAGELSANAAAEEAGFRKKPTPFEIVCRLLPKLTAAENAPDGKHIGTTVRTDQRK
jgi:hypothetical protein